MRSRLAFAISMVVEFDCFLIDEIIAVGDSRFSEKCRHELFEKRKDRAMIIVSHQPEQIRAHCSTILLLNQGRIEKFNDIDEAYEYYSNQI
jgi:ABC-type polysaccharide/polyol phosphate transport system ATPase subunit